MAILITASRQIQEVEHYIQMYHRTVSECIHTYACCGKGPEFQRNILSNGANFTHQHNKIRIRRVLSVNTSHRNVDRPVEALSSSRSTENGLSHGDHYVRVDVRPITPKRRTPLDLRHKSQHAKL